MYVATVFWFFFYEDWYTDLLQYKLDDREEQCDPLQPTTSACPLLPGQMVNILEVPTEVVEPPERVFSASALTSPMRIPQMTWNPEDRYKKIHRKPPTKLPRYYCSSDALLEKAAARGSIMEGGAVQPPVLKQQKTDAAGNKLAKRIRSHKQQARADLAQAATADLEMMVRASSTFEEARRLTQLRPLASSPNSCSGERPVTRHGTREDAPWGLGITIGAREATSAARSDVAIPSNEVDPNQIRHPLSPPASEDVDMVQSYAWPLAHPNPLRSHMNAPAPLNLAAPEKSRYSITSAEFTSPPLSPEYHNHTSYSQGQDGRSLSDLGNGLDDLVSPTFSAATAGSTPGGAGTMTPEALHHGSLAYSLQPGSSHSRARSYENRFQGELAKRLSQITSSDSNDADIDVDGNENENEEDDRSDNEGNVLAHPLHAYLKQEFSASTVTVKPLPALPSHDAADTRINTPRLSDAGSGYFSCSSSRMSLDEESIHGADFASSVLGALGIDVA